jgi:hypothetical protein
MECKAQQTMHNSNPHHHQQACKAKCIKDCFMAGCYVMTSMPTAAKGAKQLSPCRLAGGCGQASTFTVLSLCTLCSVLSSTLLDQPSLPACTCRAGWSMPSHTWLVTCQAPAWFQDGSPMVAWDNRHTHLRCCTHLRGCVGPCTAGYCAPVRVGAPVQWAVGKAMLINLTQHLGRQLLCRTPGDAVSRYTFWVTKCPCWWLVLHVPVRL